MNTTAQTPLRSAVSFLAIFLFWILLNGSWSSDVLVVGVLISLVIALFFGRGLAALTEFRPTPRAVIATVLYIAYFVWELVKSNVRLTKVVLSPRMPIKPGIVKVRTRLKTRMGRLLLANSITLTPGTLTVELEGEWLYVHWVTMESADVETATASIVSGFERYLEVMYG